jgi:peptide/nickel transport system permease protein/oligopeptide transport system permease protein
MHADAEGNPTWMNGKNASQWANIFILLVGIGAVSWLTLARVVRGQVMSLRDQPFIEAARALGFPWHRIISKHILPNLVGTIVVYGTLTVPAAILSESFLSFLGLGIQAPLPSWGNLAADGTEALNPVHIRWWLITWPCLGLSVALLSLNFLGDGIRDALDPKAVT